MKKTSRLAGFIWMSACFFCCDSYATLDNTGDSGSISEQLVEYSQTNAVPSQPGLKRARREKVPGEILVKFKEDSPSLEAIWKRMASGKKAFDRKQKLEDENAGRKVTPKHKFSKKFDALLEKHKIPQIGPAFRIAQKEAARGRKLKPLAFKGQSKEKKRSKLFHWYRIKLPDGLSVDEARAEFEGVAEIELTEPNYEWHLADTIDPPITGLPDATTDPSYDSQWHLASAKIPNAWNYLKDNGVYPGGKSDVVVAVIDTGVDYTHGELAGNMWINGAEIPDNGIDDDGDGFVDDIHGCNVVSDPRSHSGDPMDYHGHGTHVSGIIAAQAFNGIGGVGVAFNTKIMAVRAAQYSGTLTTEDIAEGILYATDHGADVINMSFGGYQYSQMVVDALQVALSQAVLVAAAGNDGILRTQAPQYPAHLPWVIGVEAANMQKGRAWFSNAGYELSAPGISIFSTLPNDQYAAWGGTSMAAPIVSGVGALMRSYFWQREVYSSRFLMASMVASGGENHKVVDAYKALTEPPRPGVSLYENWIFDDEEIDAGNDGDGRADSGETIHLAIELINRAGQSSNVVATLRAHANGAASDDPFVTIISNTVAYGEIGPFALSDNGFIYDNEGVITGVDKPFIVSIDPNCPNDHVIPFELTTTFYNGWDPTDLSVYTRIDRFKYIVQRGKNVPTVISEDTTLSSDDYWMLAGPVLIEEGATLTVEEGTQLQFGSISDDPYNPGPQNGYMLVRGNLVVEGSVTNPVNIFPSYLVSGQTADITVEDNGTCDMSYVRIRNPYLTGIDTVDHGYLYWDAHTCKIDANYISHSQFHKIPGSCAMTVGMFDTCLFDAGQMVPQGSPRFENCTFLQDNESNSPLTLTVPLSFRSYLTNSKGDRPFWSDPILYNGDTFVLLPIEHTSLRLAETIANYFGGHVASVRDQSESDFLKGWLPDVANFRYVNNYNHDYVYVGMSDWNNTGSYTWLDGSPITFTDWMDEYPVDLTQDAEHIVQYLDRYKASPPINVWGWKNVVQTPSSRGGSGAPVDWKSFIIRLPGEWTLAELNAPFEDGDMLDFVKTNYYQELKYNAFLSKYWDPVINHWMRIYSQANNADGYTVLKDNYWGTSSISLIDYAIQDFYDNFTSARIEYGDAPTNTFESTYPFVEKVEIGGVSASSVPVVGAGATTFRLTFNRNMNTNVQPYVTFGPSPPHTDFEVLPRDENYHEQTNGWLNARTWEGVFWITPVTGESYHMMRISGAEAADDPWLVSGYDVQRFRFRVQTMGVASMTLQANGVEGGIQLSWLQDDYDLVAGYNLYRSDAIDGTYEKINTTVIPPDQVSYLDTDVTPAVLMFYKFSVVLSGLEESDFSNIAAASALDTVPPVLVHAPVVNAPPSLGLKVSATITDNVAVVDAFVNYRSLGSSSSFQSLEMINVASNAWKATVPGSQMLPPGIEYYIVASDGISQVFSGSAAIPHQVTVADAPTVSAVSPNHGPSAGGTAVTVSGLQLGPEASVLFGGTLASNVVYISPTQVNCTTPPHFPAMVEVTVLNTNGTQATLLNGFQFEDENVVVSVPFALSGDYGATIEIPVSIANVTGLRAADIKLTYDASVLSAQSGRLGELTPGWGNSFYFDAPGQVTISLANPTTISGSGVLAYITFNIVGSPAATTALTLADTTLNDGAINITASHGAFTVNAFWSIGGTVEHFGGETVENATLSVAGAASTATATSLDGTYVLTNLPSGSYTLTPAKSDDANGITAYDASLVLQASAGSLTLSAEQECAADVNRNGQVTAMDASYILEHAVGLIGLPFPNAGKVWDFMPDERTYAPLKSDEAAQNFTAVLIGDVSGNWTNTPGQSLQGGPELNSLNMDGFTLTGTPLEPVVLAIHNTNTVSGSMARILCRATSANIYSIDLKVSYDGGLTIDEINSTDFVDSMMVINNTDQSGIMRSAIAGAEPIQGIGILLEIALSEPDSETPIILEASVNEGNVPVQIESNTASFESDTDGDGMSDLEELLKGTDPVATSSGVDLRAYQAAGGNYVEFVAYDVESEGTIMLALVGPADETLWTNSVNVTTGRQVFARFCVPELELGQSYNFKLRDEAGKWWAANGVTVGLFGVEMTEMSLTGVTLSFNSLPEREYEIQWTEKLDGIWQTLDTVTATGEESTIVADYPDPTNPCGFFRIVLK